MRLFSGVPFLTYLPAGLAIGFNLSVTSNSQLHNANHIFNAIHSSMRQWGSSLNHNGMSFFLATIPEGTEFYHGTRKSVPVEGTEWLAFEPEHALHFAGGGPPPGKGPGHGDGGRGRHGPPPPKRRRNASPARPPQQMPFQETDQKNRSEDRPPDWDKSPGYLHTYRTAHPLHLLYVDGMSAAKSELGTLDSQDIVLFNSTVEHAGFWENERAEIFCNLSSTVFENRIDGLLRMEGGFEIILCSFKDHLSVERITRAKARDDRDDDANSEWELDSFEFYRAITARYHSIGGQRVSLNYDSFVTAFNYPVDLFESSDDPSLPRLNRVSSDSIARIRNDINTLVLTNAASPTDFNWQSIADMIVTRYSGRLPYLVSGAFPTISRLHAEIERLMRPFIDYDVRNSTLEAARCAAEFLPSPLPVPHLGSGSDSESLGARAIAAVAAEICTSLSTALAEPRHDKAVDAIRQLIDYLGWTTWKECRGCGADELCIIPIWPLGSIEDRVQPRCKNASQIQERGSYWGDMGRPPH